jgi:hypothetical protein
MCKAHGEKGSIPSTGEKKKVQKLVTYEEES